MTSTATATRHARSITSTGDGDDREYVVSCACRTFYASRLTSYADAVAADAAHKAAVASGEWQAEQVAAATRLADLAPLHDAIRAHNDAQDTRRSAAFGVIIARQHGGDIEAARADLEAAKLAEVAAEAALEALR
jgi:hypothetical protein